MTSKHILLSSLMLNLALVVALLAVSSRQPSTLVEPHAPASTTNVVSAVVPWAVGTNIEVQRSEPVPFHWRMIESDDIRTYVTNLREVDCPERILRELIVTRLDDQYRPKLRAQPVDYEPWIGRDRRETGRRAEQTRTAALHQEQSQLIRELLGYDWNREISSEWNNHAEISVFLGFLSELKAKQTMAVIASKVAQLEEWLSEARNLLIDEDLERMRLLRSEIVAALARLLTPLELDELELRTQLGLIFSRQLRLDGMDLTGAEMRELMRASKAYRDFFTSILLERGRPKEADERARRAAFEREISAKLGPARLAEFQRAQEPDFGEAFQFARDNKLPTTVAVKLYETRRRAEQQFRELKADSALSAEERTVAFEVLQAATSASLASTLGGHYTNYLNSRGRWLGRLADPNSGQSKPGGRRG